MKKLLLTTVLAAAVGGASLTAITGCAAQKPTGAALATPQAIEPRPTSLTAVPESAVRVAVSSSSGGGFTIPVEKGQRWYLVDEAGNRLIKSDVAKSDGKLEASATEAKLDGRSVWTGDAGGVQSLALYLAPRYEKP